MQTDTALQGPDDQSEVWGESRRAVPAWRDEGRLGLDTDRKMDVDIDIDVDIFIFVSLQNFFYLPFLALLSFMAA